MRFGWHSKTYLKPDMDPSFMGFVNHAGIGGSKENVRHRVPYIRHEPCGVPKKLDLSCVHGKVGKPGVSWRFFGHRLHQHNWLLCPLRSSHGHGTPLHPSLRF